MNLDLDKFSERLASWFVTSAAALSTPVTLAFASAPRDLFLYSMDDTAANDPTSVITTYSGGSTNQSGYSIVPVQIMTLGGNPQLVMQRACLFHGLFFDETTKHLVRNVDLTECKFLGPTNLRVPAMIGRDDKNRWRAASNFDAVIAPKS